MGIPVMGQLWATLHKPSTVLAEPEYRGAPPDEAIKLIDDARALEMAGCFFGSIRNGTNGSG